MRLRRELGVAPSPATRALAAELRAGDASAMSAAAPPALPARSSPPAGAAAFVGREPELARLRELVARARARGPDRSGGHRGAGYRQDAPRVRARRRAARRARGRSSSTGGRRRTRSCPYEPIVGPACRRVVDPREARRCRRAVGDEAPGGRARRFDRVGAALDEDLLSAAPAPCWSWTTCTGPSDRRCASSRTSRRARAARPGCCSRPSATRSRAADDELADLLGALRRELPVEVVALEGLDEDGVAALVGAARVAHRARGACERARAATRSSSSEVLRARPGEPLDGSVVDALARRVDALGPGAASVLDAAALGGAEFDRELVADVVGLPADQRPGRARRGGACAAARRGAGRARPLRLRPRARARDAGGPADRGAPRAHARAVRDAALEARGRAPARALRRALANHALEAAAGGGDPTRAAELAERRPAARGRCSRTRTPRNCCGARRRCSSDAAARASEAPSCTVLAASRCCGPGSAPRRARP